MYTELIFQGETIDKLPHNIKKLIYYFFDEDGADLTNDYKLPDHPFFKTQRWQQIGYMSSYYFNPFSLRRTLDHVCEMGSLHVFLRCDVKNYDNEIELFINWIRPYMTKCWGYSWYEEDESPIFFSHNTYGMLHTTTII